MCWILHVYSTLYGVVYGVLTILYTECCIAKYRDTCYSAEHLLRVFLTPPAKVEPASPPPFGWGGFMRRSLPYTAGDSTGEGANNNHNHLGQFGFVAGNPCSGPFLYMLLLRI